MNDANKRARVHQNFKNPKLRKIRKIYDLVFFFSFFAQIEKKLTL